MFRNVVTVLVVAAAGAGFVFVGGCDSSAKTGALIGGLGGAGVGALIGGSDHAGGGALIGGAVGAAGGYMIGNEGDKKKAKNEAAATQAQANTVVVNVTNSNGSITPVVLTRSGNMYVDPKGNQYTSLPTPEQLKPLYGF